MHYYRLKKEAVPFFKADLATKILDYSGWKELNVDEKALEKIEPAFIEYGIPSPTGNATWMCGWDEKGAHFHFTIKYPSVKYSEFDKLSNDKVVRELMERMQYQIDSFYRDFVNEEQL